MENLAVSFVSSKTPNLIELFPISTHKSIKVKKGKSEKAA